MKENSFAFGRPSSLCLSILPPGGAVLKMTLPPSRWRDQGLIAKKSTDQPLRMLKHPFSSTSFQPLETTKRCCLVKAVSCESLSELGNHRLSFLFLQLSLACPRKWAQVSIIQHIRTVQWTVSWPFNVGLDLGKLTLPTGCNSDGIHILPRVGILSVQEKDTYGVCKLPSLSTPGSCSHSHEPF